MAKYTSNCWQSLTFFKEIVWGLIVFVALMVASKLFFFLLPQYAGSGDQSVWMFFVYMEILLLPVMLIVVPVAMGVFVFVQRYLALYRLPYVVAFISYFSLHLCLEFGYKISTGAFFVTETVWREGTYAVVLVPSIVLVLVTYWVAKKGLYYGGYEISPYTKAVVEPAYISILTYILVVLCITFLR